MNSSDKKFVWSIALVLMFMLAIFCFDAHFEVAMQEAKGHARTHVYELQVDMKKALVEESRWRAAELNLICSFVDKSGQVYLKKEC